MTRSGTGKQHKRPVCPLNCECICHDTGGGVHDHYGEPCPGKVAAPEPEPIEELRELALGDPAWYEW